MKWGGANGMTMVDECLLFNTMFYELALSVETSQTI